MAAEENAQGPFEKCGFCGGPHATPLQSCPDPAAFELRRERDWASLKSSQRKVDIAKACAWHAEEIRKNAERSGEPMEAISLAAKAARVLKSLEYDRDELLAFFREAPAIDLVCRGCGERVVRNSDDEIFGLEVNTLDLMVLVSHVKECPWRRMEPEKRSGKTARKPA